MQIQTVTCLSISCSLCSQFSLSLLLLCLVFQSSELSAFLVGADGDVSLVEDGAEAVLLVVDCLQLGVFTAEDAVGGGAVVGGISVSIDGAVI